MIKKKKSNVKRVTRKFGKTQIILKVYCYTPIAKPLNGSLPQSNASHMLRLDSIPYSYNGTKKNEKKEASTTLYFLKGMKGILRQKMAFLCLDKGLEVCHSTDKNTDKHGMKLLPKGFHLLGSCVPNDEECILHSIFGSKRHEGILSVYAAPIASIPHTSAELPECIQKVHIASENRINLAYNGKTVQDFKERYFSGYFTFEVDVTKCLPKQIGLIIEGLLHFDRLGRGYNSGYGHVEVKRLELVERTISRNPRLIEDGSFTIQKEVTEKLLPKLFQKSVEVWQNGNNT